MTSEYLSSSIASSVPVFYARGFQDRVTSARRNLLRSVIVNADQSSVSWLAIITYRAFLLHQHEAVFLQQTCQLTKFHRRSRSVTDRLAAAARVARAEAHAGLLFDHDPLGVAHVARPFSYLVAAFFERAERVGAHSKRLIDDLVRQPLMMYARRVNRLL